LVPWSGPNRQGKLVSFVSLELSGVATTSGNLLNHLLGTLKGTFVVDTDLGNDKRV
jgi:hypothetical protein